MENISHDILNKLFDLDPYNKELISLCDASIKFNELCEYDNQKIFRELLYKYFKIKNHEEFKISPKKLYMKIIEYPSIAKFLLDKGCDDYKQYIVDLNIWFSHYDQILKIYDEHYGNYILPRWVNRKLFKEDIILDMFNEFLNNFDDLEQGDEFRLSEFLIPPIISEYVNISDVYGKFIDRITNDHDYILTKTIIYKI